ncbi:hypothetical protein BCR44DRAFT_1226666 [Catenaria anguillulae PL171]|uniref:Uncharacterized protein n=1 Tax=Catenaria anguillulae PL171 TaxID=765915 RepID=A0A1Y2HE96_9FUNG|nr:hypothetical protein BCR44DRAFT_1226666 [Catenaria anguillulae PL171]
MPTSTRPTQCRTLPGLEMPFPCTAQRMSRVTVTAAVSPCQPVQRVSCSACASQSRPQIQPSNLVPSLPTDPPSNAITAAEDLAPQSKCISAAERALPAAEQKHAPPSRALTQPTPSFANVSKKAVASQAKQTKNAAPEPDDRPQARLSSSIPKNPPTLSTGEQTGQAQHQAAIRIVHQEPVVERKRRVIDEVDEDYLGAGLAGIESIFDAPLPEPAAVSSVPPLSQDQPAPSTPLTGTLVVPTGVVKRLTGDMCQNTSRIL